MKNTLKHNKIVFNTPGLLQLPFLLTLSCAALQLLLFSVTVKLPSYTLSASGKDLLNFHSPIFSYWTYIWQVAFSKTCQTQCTVECWHHLSNRSKTRGTLVQESLHIFHIYSKLCISLLVTLRPLSIHVFVGHCPAHREDTMRTLVTVSWSWVY